MPTFANKKALVLGGSRGIGAAIVRRLAADGADVTFTYAGSADAAAALAAETGAKASHADSTSRKAMTDAIADSGPLDILVVNAGTAVLGDALELAANDVDRMIDLNVRSPYHAAVAAAKAMPEGGRIIIIGSSIADRVPVQGGAAYGLTKSALQGLARGLSRDLGPRGITVNVVQPGPVDTDLNPADGPMADSLKSVLAIKRYAEPSEVAGMVAYLAGPEASYITGSMHTIDGGMAA